MTEQNNFTTTAIDFSSSKMKTSTPTIMARRRVRRSSGPEFSTIVRHPPSPTGKLFITSNCNTGRTNNIRQPPPKYGSRSTEKINSRMKETATAATATAHGSKQEKPFQDMKLEPSTVLKVLSNIVNAGQSEGQIDELYGKKLRDLLGPTPKSCRNLMQQFDDVIQPIQLNTRVASKVGSHVADGKDSVLRQIHESINLEGNVDVSSDQYEYEDEHPENPDDRTARIQRMIQQLRQSTKDAVTKYHQTCQADYYTQRNAILDPELIDEGTSKLTQFSRTLKSMTSQPTKVKLMQILSEKKPRDGIPCPVEEHANIVESIIGLDGAVFHHEELMPSQKQYQFTDSMKMNEVIRQKGLSMENDLDRLQTVQQEFDRVGQSVEITRARYKEVKLNELEMVEMQKIKTEMSTLTSTSTSTPS